MRLGVAQFEVGHVTVGLYRIRILKPAEELLRGIRRGLAGQHFSARDMGQVGTDALIGRGTRDGVAVYTGLVDKQARTGARLGRGWRRRDDQLRALPCVEVGLILRDDTK